MELSFFVLLFSLLMGGITGTLASQNNRSFRFWFYMGVLFPLITLLILLLLPPLEEVGPTPTAATEKNNAATHDMNGEDPTNNTSPIEPKNQRKDHQGRFWYYLLPNEQSKGPFLVNAIKSLIQTGDLTSDDYVWSPGMEKWEKIANLTIFTEKVQGS